MAMNANAMLGSKDFFVKSTRIHVKVNRAYLAASALTQVRASPASRNFANSRLCCAVGSGDYHCDCVPKLTGKRCEYGRYCAPNPCRHGGVCEEGDGKPLCKCRGYTGDLCTVEVDECLSSPCLGGATCVNEVGTYRCVCPANMTGNTFSYMFQNNCFISNNCLGSHCNISLYTSPITFSLFNNLSKEELIGIIGAAVFIIVLIILIIIIRKCCTTNRRDRARINNETRKEPILLNSARSHELTELKRNSKLSNLEVNRVSTTVFD